MRFHTDRHFTSSLPISIIVLAAVVFPATLTADSWSKSTAPHFELFTTGSASESRQALAALEGARAFFSQSDELPVSDGNGLRVIAFHSTEEYAPYRLHKAAFGHYLKASSRDFIVLSDIRPEHRDALIHEYTHFVVRQAGYNLPIWLNEGLADLYSSLQFDGGCATAGLPLPTRLRTIAQEGLIPLSRIFAATRESSHTDESHTLSGFYAESWAVTHMLKFHPAYAPGFARFLAASSKGFDTPTALRIVFGKEVRQVDADLRNYLPKLFPAATLEVPVKLQPYEPASNAISDADAEFVLVDLLAEQSWTRTAAQGRVLALASQYPSRPEPDAILAELLWKQGKVNEARAHLTRAVDLGGRQSGLIYRLAEMERETGASNEQLISRLRQATALDPGNADAAFNLAVLEFNEHRFNEAKTALASLKSVRAEWASTYFCMAAYCELQSRNLEQARSFGNMAKQRAITTDDKAHADQLLQRLASLGD